MIRLFTLLGLFAVALPSYATNIEITYIDGDDFGFNDSTAVEAVEGNPGLTRGDQARNNFRYVSNLMERVVWVPETVVFRMVVGQVAFTDGTAGTGGPVLTATPGLTRFNEQLEVPGIVDGFAYPAILVSALSGVNSDRTDHEGSINLSSVEDWDFSIPFNPESETLSSIPTLMHEYVHVLGHISTINPDGSLLFDGVTGIFDRYIKNNNIDPVNAIDMTQEQRASLHSAGNDVRFAGPVTVANAPNVLVAGHVAGEVFLSGDPEQQALSHVSDDVDPNSLMRVLGAQTVDLGISAYMLSDLGWGEVTDTVASVADGGSSNAVVSMSNETSSANAVVTMRVDDAVSIDNVLGSPATCTTAAGEGDFAGQSVAVCTFETVDGAVNYDIDLALDGAPGIYTVFADVDLQSMHVDPQPVNNFAETTVLVGENTIDDVSLSEDTIPENEPAGTSIGNFIVASSVEGVAHSFNLVTGEGSDHNSCFAVEGDQLVSTVEFDFEAQSSFDIRVETMASNGFSREDTFNVTVSDVGGTTAFNFEGVSFNFGNYAYASPGGERGVYGNPFLALWGLAVMVALLGVVVRRSRLVRASVYASMVFLLVACGGGGGGGSSSAPAPAPAPEPTPAFSCP